MNVVWSGSWLCTLGALLLSPPARSATQEPGQPLAAFRVSVLWTGTAEPIPEGLACLDLDRDGEDDVAVVDAKGIWVLNPQEPKATPLRIAWPAEAPVAPTVRDPHATVVELPGQPGAGVTIAPSCRGGFGLLKPATASRGLPVLTWTMEGAVPLAANAGHLLTGMRVAGTHHVMGLRLGDSPLRHVPPVVRAVVLMRGPDKQTMLVAATAEGVSVLALPHGRAVTISHSPGLAPPLLVTDVDEDGVDELWSARDTTEGQDSLILSKQDGGKLSMLRRVSDPGGRVTAMARCTGSRNERIMVLSRSGQDWRVVEVKP